MFLNISPFAITNNFEKIWGEKERISLSYRTACTDNLNILLLLLFLRCLKILLFATQIL
jgi:hypothetical protein